ncbi:MAG: hypothetical protein AAFU64_07575 [Bacteroidota bacterium]
MNKILKTQDQLPEKSPADHPAPSRKAQLQKEAQHYRELIQDDLKELAIKSAKVVAVVGSTYFALRMMGFGRKRKKPGDKQKESASPTPQMLSVPPPPPPPPKSSGLWKAIKNKALTLVLEIISDKVQQSITKPQNKDAE